VGLLVLKRDVFRGGEGEVLHVAANEATVPPENAGVGCVQELQQVRGQTEEGEGGKGSRRLFLWWHTPEP